VLRLRDPAGAR